MKSEFFNTPEKAAAAVMAAKQSGGKAYATTHNRTTHEVRSWGHTNPALGGEFNAGKAGEGPHYEHERTSIQE